MALFADGLTIDAPYLIAILAGAATVIGGLFKLLVSSKDQLLAAREKEHAARMLEVESLKKTYHEIAVESVRSAKDMANFLRRKENLPPVELSLPVVPEGSSPPTSVQMEAAQIASLRAVMVDIKKAVGQPPREEPGRNTGGGMEEMSGVDADKPPSTILAEIIRNDLAAVPERTAERVVEKIKEIEAEGDEKKDEGPANSQL